MGVDKTNVNVIERSHSQDVANPVDEYLYRLGLHYGNIGLDSQSPDECDAAAFVAAKTAATQSQAAFDTAASTAWGSWYDGLTTHQKELFRAKVDRHRGPP